MDIKDKLKIRLKVATQVYFMEQYGASFFISHDENGFEIENPNNLKAMESAKPIIGLILSAVDDFDFEQN